MSLFELLLLVVLGFAAAILLIIAGLYLKSRCFRGRSPPSTAQFTVGGSGGGDEDTEVGQEHVHFLQRSTRRPQLMSGSSRSRINLEVELDTRSLRTNPSATDLRHTLQSRPSAPILGSSGGEAVEEGRRFSRSNSRQNFYSSTSSIHHRPLEDIRQQQEDLIRNGITFNYEDTDYNLILAVDASQGTNFGGYCIDLKGKSVEFYSVDVRDLPWRDCTSDFEMKNFLFALMLWFGKIKESRRIKVYTGYRAQNYDNKGYGRRALKLLEHYAGCEGISVGNQDRYHVSYGKDPKSFSIHIQPAEDLSAEDFKSFFEFVRKYYGIDLERFEGSHEIEPIVCDGALIHQVTKNYHIYIDKVASSMKAWTEPCSKCGYVDDHTASVLSLNRIAS